MNSKKPTGLRSGHVRSEPALPQKNPFKSLEKKGELQSSEPSLPHAQGDSHPKSAAPSSHDLNRAKCCILCWTWTPYVLNDKLKTGIHSLFFAGVELDYSDRRIPVGICKNCKNGIYEYIRTNVNSRKLDILHSTFDHVIITPSTRSEQKCTCQICAVAKGPIPNVKGRFKKSTGPNKKLESIPENAPPKPPVPKKTPNLCPDCLSEIGPGLPHNCCEKTLEKNLQKKSEEHVKAGERAAARTLRSKKPSPGGRIHLALGNNAKMAVAVNAPPASTKKVIDPKELRQYCLEMGMGIGKQIDFARQMNEWFGPGSVASGFQPALREMSKAVSGKCNVTQLEFEVEGAANLVSLPIWAVNDLDEYVNFLHEQRGLHFSETIVVLGIDRGQNFLKTTLQVIDLKEGEASKESQSKFKSSGVRKLHFAAICDHQVPETYYNTQVILNHIKAHKVKYIFVSDLKMQNIYHGKQSHACAHPCHICPAPKSDFLTVYPLNTYKSMVQDNENWLAHSGERGDLKDYFNQEFKPIGVEHMTEEQLKEFVLLNAPCPPLHLVLATNTLIEILQEKWEWGLKEWLKLALTNFKNYFGGTLEGNDCSKLLDSYGILENLARENNKYDIMPFIDIVKGLCRIKKACFSVALDPNFEAICDEFKDSLIGFDEIHESSITPKFHMLAIHVKQYCKMTGKTFRLVSEQALESSHRAWKKHVEKFWVSPNNPLFFVWILRAFESWNSDAI